MLCSGESHHWKEVSDYSWAYTFTVSRNFIWTNLCPLSLEIQLQCSLCCILTYLREKKFSNLITSLELSISSGLYNKCCWSPTQLDTCISIRIYVKDSLCIPCFNMHRSSPFTYRDTIIKVAPSWPNSNGHRCGL